MVRSGNDIIKIAWEPILDRCFYAGVSANPSDNVEPPYQGVETSGNVISSYFHLILYKWKYGTNWKHFLVAK